MAIKNLSDIEKMLNLEAGTLQKGIESDEEISIELPSLVVRTQEQEQEFQANIEAQKKERYEAGREKREKELVNDNIEKYGLNLDGTKKTFDNVLEAMQAKLQKEVGKPKDAKVEELQKDIETLQSNLKAVQGEYDEYKQSTTQRSRQQQIDAKLVELLPKDDNLLIPKSDLVDLFKAKHQIEWQEDNSFLIKDRDGNVLKDDKTTSPLQINQVAEQFSSKYVKKQETGSGAGDSVTSKAPKSSYDKFVIEMQEKGLNQGSQPFMEELRKRQTEGTIEL